jgi:hypothetical protein
MEAMNKCTILKHNLHYFDTTNPNTCIVNLSNNIVLSLSHCHITHKNKKNRCIQQHPKYLLFSVLDPFRITLQRKIHNNILILVDN